jgi:hypothetical protein
MIDFLNNRYINLKYQAIKTNAPHSPDFQCDTFTRFIQSLNLKDYLISEPHEIYSKYAGYLSKYDTKVWASDCFSIETKTHLLNDNYLWYYLQCNQENIYKIVPFFSACYSQPNRYWQ